MSKKTINNCLGMEVDDTDIGGPFLKVTGLVLEIRLFGKRTQQRQGIIPEPSSMLLLGFGLFGMGALRNKKLF